MIDREKAIKGLERFIADFKPFCGNKSDWQRVDDALALLKDSGQDEGWLCEKQTSVRKITDLLCACGNKVYFTTLLFKDGFTANELYCPNCGLSMRSPHHDKDGVWLRKHWEEVVLKAQEPHIVTIADYKNNPNVDKDGNLAVWRESRHFNGIAYHEDGWVVLNRDRVEGWFNTEVIRFWTSRPTDEQREATPWMT